MEAEKLIHDGFVKAYYMWNQKAKDNTQWAAANPLIFEVEKQKGGFNIITNITYENKNESNR